MALPNRYVFLIVAALGLIATLIVMAIALRQGEAIMRTGDRPFSFPSPSPTTNRVPE